jgi:rSAM/selenodomain-associated transferase 2
MFLSIIIPTYNEAEHIVELIKHLQKASHQNFEIIVADGGSSDGTCNIVEMLGIKLINAPDKGRALQMNYAAKQAIGDILYFVHADSLPPLTFIDDIEEALSEGFPIGCYRFKFNSNKKILQLNAYFTRFDRLMCRGGDQSLFITKIIFNELNGYCEQHKVMEDYDIIIRARKKYSFKIIPKDVLVSARKYDQNSYLKVNVANFLVFMMFYAKFDHDRIIKVYKKMLNHERSELKY